MFIEGNLILKNRILLNEKGEDFGDISTHMNF